MLGAKVKAMAGFGWNATLIWSAVAIGGVPKMTNPAAAGSCGAASRAMWPPRLQPTMTALSALVAWAKAWSILA
jgi:hypothetical protein